MADYEYLFKAYDIRGVYPDELTEDFALKLGKALSIQLAGQDIMVGRDCRIGSDKLADALMQGIISQGSNAINIGFCTTPMSYFAAQQGHTVMITASHNPKKYNGFKICGKGSLAVGGNGLSILKDLVLRNQFPKAKKKGRIKKKDIGRSYLNHVKKFGKKIKKSLKIVVDAGNGMAGLTAKKIIPCHVIPLFFEQDGNFPNRPPNPLKPGALDKLSEAVKKNKADLGVGYDGDADRVVFVDSRGAIIPGDIILVILAQHYLKKHQFAKILYDATSSWIVREAVVAMDGVAIMTRIGHTYINEIMRQEDALLAGEVSGHYYFKDNFYTDSGDIAVRELLEAISTEKKSLTKLASPWMKYARSGTLSFPAENPLAVMSKIEKHFQGSGAKIYEVDGVSVEFPDWWFNLRGSNTEPLIRLHVEAKTKANLDRKVAELRKLIS